MIEASFAIGAYISFMTAVVVGLSLSQAIML